MAREFIIRKEGRFWRGRNGLDEYMKAVKDGEKIKVICSKANKRSLAYNGWIHAILPPVRDALRKIGYNEIRTVDDAKDFIKALFFRKDITNGIETVTIIQGTSEVPQGEFIGKAEDIIIWGREYLGIDIAPPDHQFEFFE